MKSILSLTHLCKKSDLRYFLHLAYQGQKYHGWQRQTNHVSVQGTLESTLSEILKQPIRVIGCGRTDAGVHASQYFAHFDVETIWDYDLHFRLNKRLPDDIAIFDIFAVEQNQHVRYDAISRTYEYFIHTYKDPHLDGKSGLYPYQDLRLADMQKALDMLTKYIDFRTFCRRPEKMNTTICHLTEATLFTDGSQSRHRVRISGNRFLTGMIRLIVGELLMVGQGKCSLDKFENYLVNKPLLSYFNHAYPQGLYLAEIIYPNFDLKAPLSPASLISPESGKWIPVVEKT